MIDPFGQCVAKAQYFADDFTVSELDLEAVRRKRLMAPLLRDEDLDLTINELLRIRERPEVLKRNNSRCGKLVSMKPKARKR